MPEGMTGRLRYADLDHRIMERRADTMKDARRKSLATVELMENDRLRVWAQFVVAQLGRGLLISPAT